MTKEELFGILQSLRKANFQGGGRSPYKPLLILWLLGQFKANGTTEFPYKQLEVPVTQLIDEFSQVSTTKNRAFLPFFHLEKEIWNISGVAALEAKRKSLIDAEAVGVLNPGLVQLLNSEPTLIEEVAKFIIDVHFTDSYVSPIFSAVGLDESVSEFSPLAISLETKKRDPKFRTAILKAWRMRCAMCGYDGQLGTISVGLEAAHVKWFSQGGPDDTDNGIALCELHHSLFDLGVLGLDTQMKIQVSEEFIGKSKMSDTLVYALHGNDLQEPLPSAPQPLPDYVMWHTKEVFKSAVA